MGNVVQLRRPDPADAEYAAEVRHLCFLGRIPDRADDYIRRRTSIRDVLSDCTLAVFGRRVPWEEARRLAEMRGPAGTSRRPLSITPEPHGIRRRPT